jgi:hypothetical protein
MTETWPVASHGPLTEIAPGLWTVDATLDLLPIGRRMTVWRAGDGRLAVHSAVCVDAPTLAALEVLGPIGWIVVPSGFHRLDAPRWKARFPAARWWRSRPRIGGSPPGSRSTASSIGSRRAAT